MSSNEGSNGNKRKAEDKKRNAKKRKRTETNVYDPSTSSETRQNKQAQEDKNWIKCIKTDPDDDNPNCKECDEDDLCIEINPKPFIMHYKESHPKVPTRETMSWIFTQFDFVKHKQHLKCKRCDDIVEVPFQGPLVDHILTDHKEKAAKQDDTGESSQGSHKDAETRAKLIQYLYIQHIVNYREILPEFATKFRECQAETRRRMWFIKHWDIHRGNYKEDQIKCLICLKDERDRFFNMSLNTSPYRKHIIKCLKQKGQSLSNNRKWLTEYFLFRDKIMWCTKCKKPLNLRMKENALIQHLKNEHDKEEDGELLPDNQNLNRLVSRFINHLIDKFGD